MLTKLEDTHRYGAVRHRSLHASIVGTSWTIKQVRHEVTQAEGIRPGEDHSHLVHGVHRLHDPVLKQLEVAELDGVVHAVVL